MEVDHLFFLFWVSAILLMTENFHYHYSQQKLYSFLSSLETVFKKFPNQSLKRGGGDRGCRVADRNKL